MEPIDALLDGAASDDADLSVDAPLRCNAAAQFGEPVHVPAINSSLEEENVWLDPAEMTLHLGRGDGSKPFAPVTASRTSLATEFGTPVANAEFSALVSVTGNEYLPWVSGDGLTAYFHRQTTGTSPAVFVAVRASTSDVFDAGSAVTVAGTQLTDAILPRVSRDGQRLYWIDFYSFRLQAATRTGGPTQFGPRAYVTSDYVSKPVLSADELTLYYAARGDAAAEILSASRGA